MSEYLITRTRKSAPTAAGHKHVIEVEINEQLRTVAEVIVEIRNGEDDFYTLSPSTGKRALIHPWTCCGMPTLHSDMKSVPDNNLDSLPVF